MPSRATPARELSRVHRTLHASCGARKHAKCCRVGDVKRPRRTDAPGNLGAPRPVCMNRAGEPVTVHAHPARDRYASYRRALPDPQGHRARQETCHARCVPGPPAPTWLVMTTPVPRFPNTPALSWRLRTGRAAAPPTPPAERRSGQRGVRFQVFSDHRAHRPPYSFTSTPTASVPTDQRFSARGGQALPVNRNIRRHTCRPP